MAEEQNLNGLAGSGSGSGAQNAVRVTARSLIQEYWNPAKMAASQIRRDMEAAERASRNIGKNVGFGGKVDLSGFDSPSGGLGQGQRIMARPTFSVNSSGQATRLSQGTSIMPTGSGGGAVVPYRSGGPSSVMPFGTSAAMGSTGNTQRAIGSAGYYNPQVVPYGGGGGGIVPYGGGGGQIMPYGNQPGGTPPGGGGGGGNGGGGNGGGGNGGGARFSTPAVIGAAAVGGLAAYGASQMSSVTGRDFMAQQLKTMGGGNVGDYYQGQYATIYGQTSTADMLQGRGMLNRMGFLPGTSQYANLQQQMSTLSSQQNLSSSAAGSVMQNIQSANVSNRGRAMLGINTRDSNGVMKDYNTLAKQIMGKLYSGGGAGPTRSDISEAVAPGRAIDYALDQLGLSADAKSSIESSMFAQATDGMGINKQSAGKAATSKMGSIAAGSNIEGTKESGSVDAASTFNDAAGAFKSAVNDFVKAVGGGYGLGASSGALGHLTSGVGELLGARAIMKLGGKALGMGGGAGGAAAGRAGAGVVGRLAGSTVGTGVGVMGLEAAGAAGPAAAAAAGVGAVGLGVRYGGQWLAEEMGVWDKNGTANNPMSGGAAGTATAPTSGGLSGSHRTYNPGKPTILGGRGAAFNGSDGAGPSSGGGSANGSTAGAVAIAMKYLGQPYVWGGSEPGGFDCSGLVQYVYKQLGVNLPHKASLQARMGTAVGSLAQAIPGDLLFWGNPAHHVAIYIGSGKMIAAPHTGTNVQVQNVYGNPYIRRVLGNSSATDGKNSNNLTVGMGASGSGTMDSGGGASSTGLGGDSIAAMLSGTALSMSSTGISGSGMTAGAMVSGGLSGASAGSMGIGGSGSTMATGGGGGTSTNAVAPNAPSASKNSNVALAKKIAAKYGWGSGPQWNALYATINEESSFSNTAQNPKSTAYGLGQFLDSTWKDMGVGKTSDPATQLDAMDRYIKQRYGNPVKEWAFHKKNNYYAQGAFEIAQDQDARLHAGEMVVTKDQADKVRSASRKGGGGGGNVQITINTQTIDDAAIAKVVAAVKKANQTDSMTTALMMGTN
jgi:cell wall-associated NlpC family hydrolase